jgi:hypothetical protein
MWVWHERESREYICGLDMDRIAGNTYVGIGMDRIAGNTYDGFAFDGIEGILMWVRHGQGSREYIFWDRHGQDSREYICGFGMDRKADTHCHQADRSDKQADRKGRV